MLRSRSRSRSRSRAARRFDDQLHKTFKKAGFKYASSDGHLPAEFCQAQANLDHLLKAGQHNKLGMQGRPFSKSNTKLDQMMPAGFLQEEPKAKEKQDKEAVVDFF